MSHLETSGRKEYLTLKMTNADVFVGGPGKNYITLKIMTDEGIYGLGDATLNNRETLPAASFVDYLIPCLLGKAPCNSEDLWQYLYRGAYFRRGPLPWPHSGPSIWRCGTSRAKCLVCRCISFLAARVGMVRPVTLRFRWRHRLISVHRHPILASRNTWCSILQNLKRCSLHGTK